MNLVIIRGGGDLATGIGHRLYRAGFKIIILEKEKPLAIRRTVSFSNAVYDGEITVEDIKAVYCKSFCAIMNELSDGNIPVLIDPKGKTINTFKPLAIIDSKMAKENTEKYKGKAPITIGIGPGFNAGLDVDLVVESNRGHNLGKVIYEGYAASNTGIPADIMGYKEERIIKAIDNGIINWNVNIGDYVKKNVIIGDIDGIEISSNVSGLIRGLIKDGLFVGKGLKIGDIDPRGEEIDINTISDKARAIGGGVLEGIMYMTSQMHNMI